MNETQQIKPLVAGNWKMNGLQASVGELRELVTKISVTGLPGCDFLICPPATLIADAAAALGESVVMWGGQDCHAAACGAHTGDISAEMLADLGCGFVIVGHSERRADHGESDAAVAAKAVAAWRAGLVAIVCVGETEMERDAGEALQVVKRQLQESLPEGATRENTVVAYEPVWAIGTGRVPSVGDVAEVHETIREHVGAGMRILYGGSVKPENASELMSIAHVNGALVGGASLKAADFYAIAQAAYG